MDSTVGIFDAETGKAVGEPFYGHTNSVLSVAYSPDGRRIVSSSADSTVRVWDAETGEVIGCPLCGHSLMINSVTFSPDGRWIVSGSDDTTIRVWDASFIDDPETFFGNLCSFSGIPI